MNILGLSAYYHDAAACLVVDGRIVAAAQEERFTRKKHDARFPRDAIAYCLSASALRAAEIDHVVFYEKPFLKFERLLETYFCFAPRGFAAFRSSMQVWLREKLFLKSLLQAELEELGMKASGGDRLLFSEHHLSHAASAFYPSPFGEAVVLTMDGVGEWATGSVSIGEGNRLEIQREMHFPHSLGLLYSAFTYYLGFKVNSGEYKVMGLAPYGQPKYAQVIRERLIDVKPDGSFRLDMSYFDYCTGLRMTNTRFDALFGGAARNPQCETLSQRHMDLAASVQAVTDEVMLRLTRALASEHGIRNLCLAGGVALNCVTNGKILRDGRFDELWIQPASGDAGGAVGAALAVYHKHLNQPRSPVRPDAMQGSYLGPAFPQESIEASLRQGGAVFEVLSDDEIYAACAKCLADGKALGWFRGRMEFGPRALGNRSILADARSPSMQRALNLKVKYRESFRPFAPAVLKEECPEWFELDCDSPYMLLVADVAHARQNVVRTEEHNSCGMELLHVPRSQIPAVTHIDGSARIQTVDRRTNPDLYGLIGAFRDLTGCPVLVNTSFNIRGEPIVCSPEDAFRCFMGTEIEVLVVGNCLMLKERQSPGLRQDYRGSIELD